MLELFGCLLLQGVIGYVQYFMGLPEIVVGLHMFGSALVWIAVLRVGPRRCATAVRCRRWPQRARPRRRGSAATAAAAGLRASR